MMHYLPVDDNIFGWDPEDMEQYWLLCQRFDHYTEFTNDEIEKESQQGFESGFVKSD